MLQRHQSSATDYCKIFHKIIPYLINSNLERVSIGSHHLCLWTLLFCFRLSKKGFLFGMILFTFIFFLFSTAALAPCAYTSPYGQRCTIQQILKNLQQKFNCTQHSTSTIVRKGYRTSHGSWISCILFWTEEKINRGLELLANSDLLCWTNAKLESHDFTTHIFSLDQTIICVSSSITYKGLFQVVKKKGLKILKNS